MFTTFTLLRSFQKTNNFENLYIDYVNFLTKPNIRFKSSSNIKVFCQRRRSTSHGLSIRQMLLSFHICKIERKQWSAFTAEVVRHELYLPAKRKAWSHILSFSLSVENVDVPEKFEAPEMVLVRFLPLAGLCHVLGSSTDILSIESIDSRLDV